jgi:hypothetical protein
MIADLFEGALLLADKGYDCNALRERFVNRDAWAKIPAKFQSQRPNLRQQEPLPGAQPRRAFLQQDRTLRA